MIGRFMETSGVASISIERKWRLGFWSPVRGFEFPGRGRESRGGERGKGWKGG